MKQLTYTELMTHPTFGKRFEYLKLSGSVGEETFGHDRYLNQRFYTSPEWKHIRVVVIARDLGCDLAIPDRPIHRDLFIHHLNPITPEDLTRLDPRILDLENLITVSKRTHNAIHYGGASLLLQDYVPRQPGDTKLW